MKNGNLSDIPALVRRGETVYKESLYYLAAAISPEVMSVIYSDLRVKKELDEFKSLVNMIYQQIELNKQWNTEGVYVY